MKRPIDVSAHPVAEAHMPPSSGRVRTREANDGIDSIDQLISEKSAREKGGRGWLVIVVFIPLIAGLMLFGFWKNGHPAFAQSTRDAISAPPAVAGSDSADGEGTATASAVLPTVKNASKPESPQLPPPPSQSVDAALSEAVAANRDLKDQVEELSVRVTDLTRKNETLNTNFALRTKSVKREKEALLARIAEMEKKAGFDYDAVLADRNRLAAANENLKRQNFLLKDRLSGALLDSADLPPGGNAKQALELGSTHVESLKSRIAELEALLAGAGEERNYLARSLADAQNTKTASSVAATLNAGSGDRLLTDLSERIEAMKRQATETDDRHAEDRQQWEREKSELMTIRKALQEEVAALKARVVVLSGKGDAFAAADETSAKQAPANPERTEAAPAPPPKQTARKPDSSDSPKPPQPKGTGKSLSPAGIRNRKSDVPPSIGETAGLSESAARLFKSLKSLNDEDAPAVENAYLRLKEENGAEPLLRVAFKSGSDWINPRFRDEITSLADSVARENPHFLVIGYASADGNADSNQSISSSRARRVAEMISRLAPAAPVESVYFGQTRRFDQDNLSPNRVVEIWRLP